MLGLTSKVSYPHQTRENSSIYFYNSWQCMAQQCVDLFL